MKDRINKQQKNQRKQFAKLSKEERKEHVQLLRFSNIVIIYHEQANKFNPTEADFKEWLTGLPTATRIHMEIIGFNWCKEILSFKRYVLEKNDIGMDHWMKKNLSKEDYIAFRKFIEQEQQKC